MQEYTITSINDKWYDDFYAIYSVSFPVFEQRNREQQMHAFAHPRYHLLLIIENNIICSFIAYWDFEHYIYIEHLAVNQTLRGKNIGSETLSTFAKKTTKKILLEIDPLTDEVARKRFRFYEKLGYRTNHYTHFHPAYNPQFAPHELIVLSYPNELSQQEYDLFHDDLKEVVMK